VKAIINARLYDYEKYIENGFICFTDCIESVGDMKGFQGADMIWDAGGNLIMPGLVNFHTHAYSVFARGFDFQASPKTFTGILEEIWWRMDRVLSLEDIYASGLLYAGESIKKGVLGIIDHNASGEIGGSVASVQRGFKDAGIFGVSCFETSDRYSVDACLKENLDALSRGNGLFGLHASMTLSDSTLGRLKSVVEGKPIHVHVSESKDDQNKFPNSPLERLNRFGLVTRDSLVVHGVHMTPSDFKLLKESGAVLALAPRSNLNNAVGTLNFGKMVEEDIPFVAGTDGLGVDVAQSWQLIYYLANNQIGHYDLKHLKKAILESYGYYERITGRKTGRFDVGYAADLISIDYHPFTPMHVENAFAHVFYGVFDGMKVEEAWFGGSEVLTGGKLVKNVLPNVQIPDGIWGKIKGGSYE
jgi:cytosine/adenosine deaminase-related metal-dependent hydrolase